MFFRNEGKNVKQRKLFTVNNKQYMVHISLIVKPVVSEIIYEAYLNLVCGYVLHTFKSVSALFVCVCVCV